ncbi:MAG: L-type lectin-domain containing protein, partial [Psychroflexus maritimus]
MSNTLIRKTLSFSFFLLTYISFAQLNASLTGNAEDLGNNCFIITPDSLNQAGGVWYDNPIDFDEDFTIYYQNNFGSNPTGADGMALVFKDNSIPELGGLGGGLGYQNISPSLAVEFDTYTNSADNGDPAFDHIGIQKNGNPSHFNSNFNLAGPVQADPDNVNIANGNAYEVKIVWEASTQTLDVFFDCELRLSLDYDVKEEIFSGDDTVFFGFVGSTGGLSNLHQVCFNSISFIDNLQLENQTICENGSVSIDASTPSGSTYSWSPTEGVSNPNSSETELSPDTTTTYTVTIADVCGDSFSQEVTITVIDEELPVFDPIESICVGDDLEELPTTSNNNISGSWSPALNNTTTTTYTFTPDEDELCAQETTLEIIVNPEESPIFDLETTYCELQELP